MLRKVRYDTTRAVGYGFQIELAYRVSRAGGRIVEVPITFTDRTRGQSKMSPKVAAEELLLVTWWGLLDRLPRSRDRDLGSGPTGAAPPVPRPEQGTGT
jgi:dolichol-phosphate mannosyltransferase